MCSLAVSGSSQAAVQLTFSGYVVAYGLLQLVYGPLSDRALLRSISPIHKVDRIRAPLLILHGEADRVIPQGFGKRLFDLAKDPKTFLSLGPVGHDALFSPATWELEAAFIDRLTP